MASGMSRPPPSRNPRRVYFTANRCTAVVVCRFCFLHANMANLSHLERLLWQHDPPLQLGEVPADGDCQVHSLKALTQNTDSVKTIRKQVGKFVKQNHKSNARVKIALSGRSAKSWASNVSKSGVWLETDFAICYCEMKGLRPPNFFTVGARGQLVQDRAFDRRDVNLAHQSGHYQPVFATRHAVASRVRPTQPGAVATSYPQPAAQAAPAGQYYTPGLAVEPQYAAPMSHEVGFITEPLYGPYSQTVPPTNQLPSPYPTPRDVYTSPRVGSIARAPVHTGGYMAGYAPAGQSPYTHYTQPYAAPPASLSPYGAYGDRGARYGSSSWF